MQIADPTHGFVNYVNQQQAQSQGLIQNWGNQVYIGVDHTTTLNPNGPGRNSVRLQSNKAYNHGLIIADFAHIPGSDCGAWPAFWMFGPNWPSSGEIDIIEGVNLNTYDQVTLHTAPGCVPNVGPGGQSGSPTGNADCGAGGGYNGCGVVSNHATSYGTAFNANGGGLYATLWTSTGIKVWYWPSRSAPADARSNSPNPAGWGQPIANYAGCNFDQYFKNMNIVSSPIVDGPLHRTSGTDTERPRSSILRSAVTGPAACGPPPPVRSPTPAASTTSRRSRSRSPTNTGWSTTSGSSPLKRIKRCCAGGLFDASLALHRWCRHGCLFVSPSFLCRILYMAMPVQIEFWRLYSVYTEMYILYPKGYPVDKERDPVGKERPPH